MSSLKTLCLQLDETILQFFDTLDEVLRVQHQLETLMKDGFFLMAKARYSMGAHSVGAVQYSKDDMSATLKVDVDYSTQKEGDERDHQSLPEFFAHRIDGSGDQESRKELTSELRKRKTGDKTEEIDDALGDKNPVEDLVEAMGDVKLGDNTMKESGSPKHNDPLRWFGLLVPPALRESQARFQRAAELSAQIATLKVRLDHLQNVYREMHAKKQAIINSI